MAAVAEEYQASASISPSPALTAAQQGSSTAQPKAMQLYLKAAKAALRCDTYDLGLQLFGEWGVSATTNTFPDPSKDGLQLESVNERRLKRASEQKLGRQQGRNRTEVLQKMHSDYVLTAARSSAKALKKQQALQLAGLMPHDARVKLLER